MAVVVAVTCSAWHHKVAGNGSHLLTKGLRHVSVENWMHILLGKARRPVLNVAKVHVLIATICFVPGVEHNTLTHLMYAPYLHSQTEVAS